ncbi:hypothetical protein [Luteolibacter marinus]|uniref:hypothetical protein n=1 Tax=Luteolibacter marinus TaxID=2776705 RepID=UPI001868C49B|nr:hypothetical protein [Luteolibacter marinus]
MKAVRSITVCLAALAVLGAAPGRAGQTGVSIRDGAFLINGEATMKGRSWRGHPVEGLLPNARMVQGIFDDMNPATRGRWAYPDTGTWDPERNTTEFIRAMADWRRHGLLAFTLNLQGGSPQGYSKEQPWENSAFDAEGGLRKPYLDRLERVLDAADELGMVVILGYFYFGQDERLKDEAAVIRAVDGATDWVIAKGYRHVLVEINNECNVRYDHAILKPQRVDELIKRVQERSARAGRRLAVSTSYGGGTVPGPNVVACADFLLLHGNGVAGPEALRALVKKTREVEGYRGQPVVINEDDHFDFEKDSNHFTAATGAGASWGYFDYRMKGEPFEEGYQSVPVDWSTGSERKKGFFRLLSEMSGETP